MRQHEIVRCPVTRVTNGPRHHFFGYYDKCPWNESEDRLLAMGAPFMDHNPTAGEPATVGFVHMRDDFRFESTAETRAWNWQQGAMLRWLPTQPDTLIYNDLQDGEYVSVKHNVKTGDTNTVGDALYDISADGTWGATLNFSRIADCRPGYGYFAGADPFRNKLQPDNDGIYLIEMATGRKRLLISIAGACDIGQVRPRQGSRAWFNPIKFNPAGSRLLFFHRWADGACAGHTGFDSRVLTINVDGSDPFCLSEGCRASHFDWLDDTHVLIFLYHADGDGYYLIEDGTGKTERIGRDVFSVDGHCLYRPQKDWFLTDTYPRGANREQTLMLYHPQREHCIDVGRYTAMPIANLSWRCDLHSRWNHTGTRICFDSTHEGSRQMYVVDVSAALGNS